MFATAALELPFEFTKLTSNRQRLALEAADAAWRTTQDRIAVLRALGPVTTVVTQHLRASGSLVVKAIAGIDAASANPSASSGTTTSSSSSAAPPRGGLPSPVLAVESAATVCALEASLLLRVNHAATSTNVQSVLARHVGDVLAAACQVADIFTLAAEALKPKARHPSNYPPSAVGGRRGGTVPTDFSASCAEAESAATSLRVASRSLVRTCGTSLFAVDNRSPALLEWVEERLRSLLQSAVPPSKAQKESIGLAMMCLDRMDHAAAANSGGARPAATASGIVAPLLDEDLIGDLLSLPCVTSEASWRHAAATYQQRAVATSLGRGGTPAFDPPQGAPQAAAPSQLASCPSGDGRDRGLQQREGGATDHDDERVASSMAITAPDRPTPPQPAAVENAVLGSEEGEKDEEIVVTIQQRPPRPLNDATVETQPSPHYYCDPRDFRIDGVQDPVQDAAVLPRGMVVDFICRMFGAYADRRAVSRQHALSSAGVGATFTPIGM